MQLLIDALRLKYRQISHAIEIGEDDLVFALDRQIEPLMHDVMRCEPSSEEELFEQMKIVHELLLPDAADLASATDKATVMMLLLDRMFKRRAADRMTAPRPSPKCETFDDDVELTQAVLDQLPDGVVLVCRDQRLLFANKTFCAAHAVKPLDCIGAPLAQFLDDETLRRDILNCVSQVFATGAPSTNVKYDNAVYDIKPFEIHRGRSVAAMILIRTAQSGLA